MRSTSKDEALIRDVIKLYFTGTYYGNAAELKQAFHPDARITGSIQGTIHEWTLKEFIARVTVKPTAAEKNEKFDKEILSIDITRDAAMVKTRVFAAGYTFIDYIILLKYNNQWAIRYKSFTT